MSIVKPMILKIVFFRFQLHKTLARIDFQSLPSYDPLHPKSGSLATVPKRKNALNTDVIAEANRKLILVPIVFIALRIWGTVRFVIGAHWNGVSHTMEWIAPLQVRRH